MNIFNSLIKWRKERGLDGVEGNIPANLTEELAEFLRAEDDMEKVDALCDTIVFAVNGIEALGFDAEQAMLETMKEISSRVGDYDPELGKWRKRTDAAARAMWYQAEYERARK